MLPRIITLFLIGLYSFPLKATKPNEIRVLLDSPPNTWNPRIAQQANAQKFSALLFQGLTTIDAHLSVRPGLAARWESRAGGVFWRMTPAQGMTDHQGSPILIQDLWICAEQYRAGTPRSRVGAAIPLWKSTRIDGRDLVFEMTAPYLDFPRDAAAIRFFRLQGQHPKPPCSEPSPEDLLITTGLYQFEGPPPSQPANLQTLRLKPALRHSGASLSFRFSKDENTRAFLVLRGDVDLVLNGFSLSKTRYFQKNHSQSWKTIPHASTSVAYLGFNLRDPILKNPKIRHAIALAIDREHLIRYKAFGFTSLANSFLHPDLPEAASLGFPHDRNQAIRLLEESGYAADAKGVRLSLRYKTTSQLIGYEQAQLIQDQLKKIGVQLQLQIVEPAVYAASLAQGDFQLYSSRWIGVSSGSILVSTLFSKHPLNRVGYSDPEMDELLTRYQSVPEEKTRASLAKKIQSKMLEDLPYFPLWYWDNVAILSSKIKTPPEDHWSHVGSLLPLGGLEIEEPTHLQ